MFNFMKQCSVFAMLAAAALTSYSPEDDHDQGVCRAAFAAIDAIVANGA